MWGLAARHRPPDKYIAFSNSWGTTPLLGENTGECGSHGTGVSHGSTKHRGGKMNEERSLYLQGEKRGILDIATERGYALAAALRGPDYAMPYCKLAFQGRLRYRLGCFGCCKVTVRIRSLTIKEAKMAAGEFHKGLIRDTRGLHHWLSHTTRAFKYLSPDIPEATEYTLVLGHLMTLNYKCWEAQELPNLEVIEELFLRLVAADRKGK